MWTKLATWFLSLIGRKVEETVERKEEADRAESEKIHAEVEKENARAPK